MVHLSISQFSTCVVVELKWSDPFNGPTEQGELRIAELAMYICKRHGYAVFYNEGKDRKCQMIHISGCRKYLIF